MGNASVRASQSYCSRPSERGGGVSSTGSASNLTPVAGGGAFGYTVTLANPDAGTATNVVMTLPLPPGIWFANLGVGGAQAGAFSCVGPGVGENGSVVCRSASFVAGGAVTVDVVVTVDADLAGGIRTAKQAVAYLCMLYETLGPEWMTPDLYRFGASALLNDLLRQIYKQYTGRYYYDKGYSID